MEFDIGKDLESFVRSILKDELRELLTPEKRESFSNNNSGDSRLGWKVSTETLIEGFRLLNQYGFFNSLYPDFQLIFFGPGNAQQIKWLKSIGSLPYLFVCLKEEEMICHHPQLFKVLSEKFLDKTGKSSTPGNLRSSLNALQHDRSGEYSRDAADIDQIVSQMIVVNNKIKLASK
jgi:hypothetical protein